MTWINTLTESDARLERGQPLIMRLIEAIDRLDPERLEQLWNAPQQANVTVEESLLRAGLADEHQIARAYSNHYLLPVFDPPPGEAPPVDRQVAALLPAQLCREQRIAPLADDGTTLDVAIFSPDSLWLADDLRLLCGRHMRPFFAPLSVIENLLQLLYPLADEDASSRWKREAAADPVQAAPRQATPSQAAPRQATPSQAGPREAAESGQAESGFAGSGFAGSGFAGSGPRSLAANASTPATRTPAGQIAGARVAGARIAGARVAGARIAGAQIAGGQIAGGQGLRLAGPPSLSPRGSRRPLDPAELELGEEVFQFLDDSDDLVDFGDEIVDLGDELLAPPLETLGLSPRQLADLSRILTSPHGLVLFTGPPRSGRSTSVQSSLTFLNKPNVCTIDAQDAAKLTVASALRAWLRQDPDIVAVDQIRDSQTAQICLRAALTGHFVLSTLHCDDALSAVSKLAELEIEAGPLAETLQGVVSQRLVRRLCVTCRVPQKATIGRMARRYGLSEATTVYRPVGCGDCGGTGYRGVLPVFEVIPVDESLSELIRQRSPLETLQRSAIAAQIPLLPDSMADAVSAGLTSFEEAMSIPPRRDRRGH